MRRLARAIALEIVPRITRAQKTDALYRLLTVAGKRAFLLVAEALPRFFRSSTRSRGILLRVRGGTGVDVVIAPPPELDTRTQRRGTDARSSLCLFSLS